ncbi:hypothetical protein ACHAWT_000376 [Skeletonema menzelii]
MRLSTALTYLGLLLHSKSTSAAVTIEDARACNAEVEAIDWLILEGDANAEAIEDEVRQDLEKIGFKVNTRFLTKNDYNQARLRGDFGLSFSETWGTPYDPHSYVSAWEAEDNANHNALAGLVAPSSRDELLSMVEDVLQEENQIVRQAKWNDVHDYYHKQAMMLPLWGRRIVAIINSRLTGYQAGHQQFDFPVHKLVPVSGSTTVTISPGALTGRFQTVGNMDPHTYNPNEFFSNNWLYEGLVSYGPEGTIFPALAESWTITDTASGGQQYSFKLRPGVKFHDGAEWNCQAAKLNLDHVLAGALVEPVWHGWYGVPKYIKDWECAGDDDMELIMTTSAKFYPFLQELSFIRPLRFLSPNSFAEGAESDPYTANSCERGWGTLESETVSIPNVECAGIRNVSGTGPFAFASREQSVLTTADFDEIRVDDLVEFTGNQDYWGGAPAIETLKVVRYDSADEIQAALLDGSLDVMWGDGVLPSNSITDIAAMNDPSLNVHVGEDIQNVVLLLNTATPPLDDIRVRKSIIHAINKSALVKKELGGFTEPVDNVFPRSMPYCDVDLTPHWDYDLEKAILLSCDLETESAAAAEAESAAEAATAEAESAAEAASATVSVSAASGKNALAISLKVGLGCALLLQFA